MGGKEASAKLLNLEVPGFKRKPEWTGLEFTNSAWERVGNGTEGTGLGTSLGWCLWSDIKATPENRETGRGQWTIFGPCV